MYELKDSNGNRYMMHESGELWLKLPTKPKHGPQERFIGKKIPRTLNFCIESNIGGWQRESQCWLVSQFLLVNARRFGIKVIRIVGDMPDRAGVQGYFHPEIMLADIENRAWPRTDYELLLKVYPSDLRNTADEALELHTEFVADWNKVRAKEPEPRKEVREVKRQFQLF